MLLFIHADVAPVWALYHHDKRVLVVLECLYVLSIIFTFVFIGMVLSRPMLHGPDCHPKSISISWAFFATWYVYLFILL
jgi:hypothetical protein